MRWWGFKGILRAPHDDPEAALFEPPFERVAQAFSIAPITATVPFAILLALFTLLHGMPLGQTLKVVGMGAVIVGAWAYPVAVVFGIPFYVLFHEKLPPTRLSGPLVGALILPRFSGHPC